jgi:hypothetical protein
MTKIVTVQSQQRWEYCFETRRTEAALVVTLNEAGQQGWELVNAVNYKDAKGIVAWGAYLKRPSSAQVVPNGQQAPVSAHLTPSAPTENKSATLQGFDLSGDEFKLKTE